VLFTAQPTVAPGEEQVARPGLLLAHEKVDAARYQRDRAQKSRPRRAVIRGWHAAVRVENPSGGLFIASGVPGSERGGPGRT
jgi:hypothetical protein